MSGVSTDCRSSWRDTSEAAQANARAVERVADDEPDEREPGGDQHVAVDVERARRARRGRARATRDQQQLPEPEQAEAEDLARQQVARASVESSSSTTRELFSSTTPIATK